MIIVKISGGLGNQLFQYAVARSISIKLDRKLLLDDSWYRDIHSQENQDDPNATTIREFLLNNYKIQSRVINIFHLNWINRLKIRSKTSNVFKYLVDGPLNNLSYKYVDNKNYSLKDIEESTHIYLKGYWQNSNIIEDYKDTIYGDLVLQQPLSENNSNYLNSINASNSVAIHFRRDDYINKSVSRKVHSSCSNNYYYNGIEYVKEKITNLKYFVFSDDIIWVKDNLKFDKNTIFIDNDGPTYEHLFLMSQCKHQIIANSTYSWWAAWLNTNPDKIIITPEFWYHDKDLNNTIIRIPDNWIKINNLI